MHLYTFPASRTVGLYQISQFGRAFSAPRPARLDQIDLCAHFIRADRRSQRQQNDHHRKERSTEQCVAMMANQRGDNPAENCENQTQSQEQRVYKNENAHAMAAAQSHRQLSLFIRAAMANSVSAFGAEGDGDAPQLMLAPPAFGLSIRVRQARPAQA